MVTPVNPNWMGRGLTTLKAIVKIKARAKNGIEARAMAVTTVFTSSGDRAGFLDEDSRGMLSSFRVI